MLKARSTNGKQIQWNSPKFKTCALLRPYLKDEKTIDRLGQNIYKAHIQQTTSIENISNTQNSTEKIPIQLEKGQKT